MARQTEFERFVTQELHSISGTLGTLDKKIDLHIQGTAYELKAINRLDEQQNKLIDQHIDGVKTLKALIDRNENHNETRFQKIEEPKKLIGLFTKVMIVVGSIGASLAGLGAAWPVVKAFLNE